MQNISFLTSKIIELVEDSAIACYDWIGKGDNTSADAAAVKSMRESLNKMNIRGTIAIGEGERDEAPMLYIGEKVGLQKADSIEVDIALDPLEGTTICANAGENSLCVIAFANKGGFLHSPDVYMDKIAVGSGLPEGVIDLDNSIKTNLQNVAKARKSNVSDLVVMILERDRHKEIIAKTRETGASVRLISDGDIAGVIACATTATRVDVYMGIGGAPEGVLAAAAIRVVGGQMMGRLLFDGDEKQAKRAREMGINDINKKYTAKEMATGDVVFACSGVTSGYMLDGVAKRDGKIFINSIIMDSREKKILKTLSERK
jgi:fructose-1,6-bisphosphatase II / sedoheptulose-1,7-bisphosphatase